MENVINSNIHGQIYRENAGESVFRDDEKTFATTSLTVSPAGIAKFFGIITALLVCANSAALFADYVTGHNSVLIHKLVSFFYVELEVNAPAFFSTILLLSAFFLLSVISISKQKQRSNFRFEWWVLALGFLFMAFDETASIHERLIDPMRSILGKENLGMLYFAWVVPAIALVVCLGFFFLRFLLNLPGRTRLYFVVAAAMYLGGAVGLEMVEGWYSEVNGRENFLYMAMTTLEETLEMAGTIVFIWALLEYISDFYKILEFRFTGPRKND
jgi:hypothetical protein